MVAVAQRIFPKRHGGGSVEAMDRVATGLVVGKFAPLHLGHEYLIRHAVARCEHLLILSYSKPEFARCDVAQRRLWLAARFPDCKSLVIDDGWLESACRARDIPCHPMPRNDASDGEHQRWLAWLLDQVLGRQPDVIFCSEDYGPATARTLSEAFGKPVFAEVLDRERVSVPISASAIRSSPALARRWTAPEVAATFTRRLALLGGESSGKTTLAAALAERLGTSWVAEYGRELWELQGGLNETDLLKIAREQVRREEQACIAAGDWLVCDTSPLTTLGYSHWMFGRVHPELLSLALRPYDAIVLCCPDFPFVQDGTRQNGGFRLEQHAWHLERLRSGSTPWLLATGAVDLRVDQVVDWLAGGLRRT